MLHLRAVLFLVGLGFAAYGQAQVKIAGRIQGPGRADLPDANVLLLHAADSSLVKGTTTGKDGLFVFTAVSAGQYRLLISGIGYADKYAESFDVEGQDRDLGPFLLEASSAQLQGVTVSARKPLFEQKIDRMVVNVRSSITNVGGTVLDVLEKSPGVIVNRNAGTIAMAGREGVMVMVNGKMTYMPPDALIQYLQGLNASNVEKIELITTPPAQYDASGNAGMINIVLINNPDEGFNGTVSASMGVGAMDGTQPMASVSMNFRQGPLNLYGSYSFSKLQQEQTADIYRSIGKADGQHIVETNTFRDPFQRNHDYRLGLDYALSKRTVAGFIVAGYNHRWQMTAQNESLYKIDEKTDTALSIANQETNYWRNWMANANITHTIREGEALSFNIDYLKYKDDNPTAYQQRFSDGNGQFLYDQDMNSGKKTVIDIWASQFDYSKKLNEKISLQMGIKGTMSRFSNDVLVEREENGQWVPDMNYTANYRLKENIEAAYVSADIQFSEKMAGKAGLRYEHTYSNLGSDQKADIVNRRYGNLFPSIFLSRALDEKNRLNLSYSKRITRPTFNNLAPFLIFFDPKTFISGNPALQPAISNNVSLAWLHRQMQFAVGYSYEKSGIGDFQNEFDTATNTQTIVAQNLDHANLLSFTSTIPVDITRWWTSSLNLGAYWQQAQAHFANGPVRVEQWYFTLSGAETFRLPKKITLELSGFFQSRTLFGAAEFGALGALNAAVQKKFLHDQLSLTAGVDDIFSSSKWIFTTQYSDQDIYSRSAIQMSFRMFKIGASYRFGNKLLKDSRSRETATEEERRRVQ